jgi:penicillin G amidase
VSDPAEQLRSMAAASLFPVEGELKLRGLGEAAEVRRDDHGVYGIDAASLDDLWFAQGVVTAGERLFQLDLALRAASGRLSELFGDRTVPDDRFARTVGLHVAGRTIAAGWNDESRTMHGRFREGVFAWVDAMPAPPIEYTLLDASPDLSHDEAAWAAAFAFLSWSLSGNWEQELLRAWIAERAGPELVEALLPPLPTDAPELAAGALDGALLGAIPRARGQGSNEWVVAGSRTASGKPLLANDPHLLALQPNPWLQLRLRAPGYAARGVALTFSPGILLGATDHHAWGATNVSGDVQDLYVEQLDETGTAARFEEGWEPLTVRREEIEVRGSERIVVDVRGTRHGPLLDTVPFGLARPEHVPVTDSYALRWVGRETGISPSLVLEAARTTSFAEFRHAVQEGLTCPGQNIVYADVDGTIGYCMTGRYPVRAAGEGTAPVPGWDGKHEWTGWIAADDLPWAENPEQGYLVTANNRVYDDAYPHMIGRDFHPPHRARRIAELLGARADHDVSSMAAIQMDTVSLPGRVIAGRLVARLTSDGKHRRAVLDLLRSWDGDLRADSAAAALVNVWSTHLARRVLGPLLGADLVRAYHAWREPWHHQVLPALLDGSVPGIDVDDDELGRALDDAVSELRERFGDDSATWRWGALHRVRFAHPLAAIPGLETLFVAAEIELGGDEQTVLQGGIDAREGYDAEVVPSWRAIWDLADLDRSVEVLTTGNSGNPGSPHWNDQSGAWASGPPLAQGTAPADALRLLPEA